MAGKTDIERWFDEMNEMREKIEKLKQIILDYLTLGDEFARASLVTALKQI